MQTTIHPVNKMNSVTDPLKSAVQQFDHWRATRDKRGPIPESLLELAENLTNQYGFTTIVKALKLSGADFRKRLKPQVKKNKTKPIQLLECLNPIPPQSINYSETPSRSIELNCKNGSVVKLKGLSIIDIQQIITPLLGQT